ncbi:PRC-barrel domain-containing protein [Rhizobacter sp. Root404]|uniref:PRC-barrel domain-containing protein n=1 Tax=Rhizobacter sp. Root404 TaxID=1736528 RepID=UPI0006F82266|nr:PRC-barrel domain-containing protein [Rhizobacter sp. Root404]KQW36533.1 photosystem reaction center subunit H [Rhizobacter sp. Root404]
MLRNLKDLQGYALRTTDGDVGSIKDFYFDDDRWVVRYLIVETGSWLQSRKVLISPHAIGRPDEAAHVLPVSTTREQVRNSPDIDTDKPVSRQHEADYLGYYGYAPYWDSVGIWGAGALPGMMLPEAGMAPPAALSGVGVLETERALAAEQAAQHADDDPHLRSCKDVTGYHIKAQDGEIGHVQGFIVDEADWAIRYLVIDTSNWWAGHQVLVAPGWIQEVSWAENTVSVNMTRAAIESAPEWDPTLPPDRAQETEIYRHYDRTGYW